MLVHIGKDKLISSKEIVGIFDLENTTQDDTETAEFLSNAEKNGELEYVLSLDVYKAIDTPRAFIVCNSKKNGRKIYVTGLSAEALLRRVNKAERGI